MVHRSMENDLRVADELYITTGCWRCRISFSSLLTHSDVKQRKL